MDELIARLEKFAARADQIRVFDDSFSRPFRDAATALRASAERERELREALETADSWLDRWASHVGRCEGGNQCSCGLTNAQYEARAILNKHKEKANDGI